MSGNISNKSDRLKREANWDMSLFKNTALLFNALNFGTILNSRIWSVENYVVHHSDCPSCGNGDDSIIAT